MLLLRLAAWLLSVALLCQGAPPGTGKFLSVSLEVLCDRGSTAWATCRATWPLQSLSRVCRIHCTQALCPHNP